MTVYISGKITGDDNYLHKFAKAEIELRAKGYDVINPCDIGFVYGKFLTYEQLMKIDLTMLEFCGAIYMLKDWKDSKGAQVELAKARADGLEVLYEEN